MNSRVSGQCSYTIHACSSCWLCSWRHRVTWLQGFTVTIGFGCILSVSWLDRVVWNGFFGISTLIWSSIQYIFLSSVRLRPMLLNHSGNLLHTSFLLMYSRAGYWIWTDLFSNRARFAPSQVYNCFLAIAISLECSLYTPKRVFFNMSAFFSWQFYNYWPSWV